MPPLLLQTFLILVSEGLFVYSGFVQAYKLNRTHNPRGLSAITIALNGAGNFAWIIYFSAKLLWLPVLSNVLMIFAVVWTLVLLLDSKRSRSQAALAIVILGPVTAYFLTQYPATSGWLAVSYNTIAATPMLIKVVKDKSPTGISAASLWAGGIASISGLVYGLLVHSGPFVIGSIRALIYLFIIAGVYVMTPKKSKRAPRRIKKV